MSHDGAMDDLMRQRSSGKQTFDWALHEESANQAHCPRAGMQGTSPSPNHWGKHPPEQSKRRAALLYRALPAPSPPALSLALARWKRKVRILQTSTGQGLVVARPRLDKLEDD